MTNTNEKLYINVWIGNLGKYNEGELVGEWFTLPCDMEEVATKIGLNEQYEEWQINDYETNIKGLEIHHYSDINKLNELAEQLDQLEEHEQLIFRAYVLDNGIQDVLRDYDSISFDDAIVYYDVNDMSDVAYQYYDETGLLKQLEEHININYIDFEAIGRDMEIEGTFVFIDNHCVQFL